jgi:hypothetical protein
VPGLAAGGRPARVAAATTFGLFAGVSLYIGYQGVASCGCFGPVPTSPWLISTVDACLAVLLYAQTQARTIDRSGDAMSAWPLISKRLVAVAVIATAVGIAWVAATRIRTGDRLTWSREIDYGVLKPGQDATRPVVLENRSREAVRIVGGTADCSCLATTGLPLVLAPGESASVPVEITTPLHEQSVLTRNVVLWAGVSDRLVPLAVVIHCRVVTD